MFFVGIQTRQTDSLRINKKYDKDKRMGLNSHHPGQKAVPPGFVPSIMKRNLMITWSVRTIGILKLLSGHYNKWFREFSALIFLF
jgi:hypothetical protein